ncbi:MAG: translation initiation factor IF-2 [Trichodesmium sp.]
MGFADISIQEIAEDFNVQIDEVFRLCHQMGISYKHSQTRLALEDAKAIMSHLLAQKQNSDSE